MKSQIELVQGDITDVKVDAIVNAVNCELILGGGVSGAVRRKAGQSVVDECAKIGTIPIGEAVVTGPGALPFQCIIHAASMSLGNWAMEQGVRDCVKNALRRADEKAVKTLAFPAVGTGVAAFPIDRCARIMFSIIHDHLKTGKSGLEKVTIVLADEKKLAIFQEHYKAMPE
ncbi:MAG: macro domain-containing protein [Planctomycetes bacterium]|nr:macro domain-containing protein [Planctomycetota bacterium]